MTIVWPLRMTLTFNLPEQNELLCQIILKSMHKRTSYGQDKLNLWPFYHLTFNLSEKMFQMNNCAKL